MRPWLLLLTLLWPLLAQDERDAAKKNKTEKVGNPKTAVVASCGLAHTFITEDCGLQTTTRFSPLSRQGVSALPQKNGADDKRSMEMWTMQKAKQTQRLLLWCVWPAMGTVLGQTIPTPLQLCNGWFNTQAEESMEGVALGILGSTAKEPEKKSLQKPSKQGQRKGRWEREIHASQGYCSWRTEKFPEMACPRPGLHQHQGGGHNRAASSENASWTQTTGILSRSTGLDRHAPGLLSRWSPLRVAGQSGQDQENVPNGSAKAHWATHESQKRTGCTEGGQVSPQGGVEATRGTTGQEHQSTALAVSECHPGLQQLRGGFGATVPGCKNGYFADHPTEQASRRRSTSPQRHGCCDADGKPYDTHQCRRRSKYAWRCRSTRRGSTSATNPIYLVRVRGITDLREDETTSGRWTRRRTCHQNCQDCKCSQTGFMNSRCGMQPTRQSVFTEHDRPRNLRFSACVGVCEHSYVGTACEQYPFCQANFEWKVLGEPKMPTTTCPRTCMTTDEAVLSTQHHTVHLERDYLDPWGAIAQAFELELDVARDGWAQVPVIDDTPLPILQCRPNHELVLDFDDNTPFRRRTRDGFILQGRTTPPPHWETGPFLPIWWDTRLPPPTEPCEDTVALFQTSCNILATGPQVEGAPRGMVYRHNGLHAPAHHALREPDEEMTDEENAEDPMLIIDEWQALLDFLRLTEESNEEHLELTTYGLKVVSIGTRTTTSSLTIDSVRETIRHTWEDFIDPGCTIYLHLIRPQAVDHAHRLQVLVEINPGDVEIPPNLVPTLRQTHWHSSGLMTTMATYLEDMITSIDILRDPALRESGCLGAVQCNVHIEGEIALPLRYYLLRPGSLVAAFVHDEQSRHPDGPADDQDDLVMMQQSALPRPSSSPTLKTVRLVGTHSTSAMIQMDTTEQFSTELETRWPFHRRSHDDIEAVHEVTDPPTFSGQAPDPMYIIEFRDDRFSQTHTDDVMGLVTIIFDETTEGLRRERLRVQWLPHKASRDNLLDFLRATWFCRRQDVICTLYHDGWLWPVHDQTLRR